MGQLAYFCAFESKWVQVINGNQKGGSVSQIKHTVDPKTLPTLNEDYHFFLDNLSGDFYKYAKG
jgi:hypothetical protein